MSAKLIRISVHNNYYSSLMGIIFCLKLMTMNLGLVVGRRIDSINERTEKARHHREFVKS